jgi:hypothetical protein
LTCRSDTAHCDNATMQCEALRLDGEPCDHDAQCAGGFCGGTALCTDRETYCGP